MVPASRATRPWITAIRNLIDGTAHPTLLLTTRIAPINGFTVSDCNVQSYEPWQRCRNKNPAERRPSHRLTTCRRTGYFSAFINVNFIREERKTPRLAVHLQDPFTVQTNPEPIL